MNCRLCKQPNPLRRSHIIPEFMHQDMYDPKHRFFGLSSNTARREQIFQKGMRKPLLCDACEQQFGRYEKYASGVFYDGQTYERRRDGNWVILSKLTYAPLKRFFMSLLWRMAVTSIEHLKGAELGPHEEKLRQLLLKEEPGDSLTYPCMVTAVMHEGKHVPDLIVQPGRARVDGLHVWSFVAAGFVFSFFVSGHKKPIAVRDALLKPDGTMWIAVRDMKDIEFLYRYACEIGEAQRQRAAGAKSSFKQ